MEIPQVAYKPTGKPPGRPKKASPNPGERPNLSNRRWKALQFESKHACLDENDTYQWWATLRRIADHVGVTKQAVWKWRQDPRYVQGFVWLIASQIEKELSSADKPVEGTRTKRQSLHALHVELKRSWNGPVQSMIDGKTYDNPDSYFEHIAESNFVWVGGQPPLGKKPRNPGL